MKFLMLFVLIFLSQLCVAQGDTSQAPFLQYPFIPPFSLIKAPDSTAYTRDDLPRKTPVIIMIFSPDCDHCKHQVGDMIAHIDQLKKFQIIMTTWLPYDTMMKFYNDLSIGNYANIVMARDTKFFFPVHYGLKGLPGMYVYDKKHRLKKNFESTVTVEKLVE